MIEYQRPEPPQYEETCFSWRRLFSWWKKEKLPEQKTAREYYMIEHAWIRGGGGGDCKSGGGGCGGGSGSFMVPGGAGGHGELVYWKFEEK